jgi:hypothetical protein
MAIGAVAALMAVTATPYVFAHEGREVYGYELDVGFLIEPAYEGQANAVYVAVARAGEAHHETAEKSNGHQDDHSSTNEHPHAGIEGVADTLTVEVTHVESGAQTRMSLQPVFEQSGAYVAPFVPTVPGQYRFRLVGTIEETNIDEVFTSGLGTFDDIKSQAIMQFPVAVPSARELAGVAKASQQDVRDAIDAGSRAFAVGLIGLVSGVAGLLVGAVAIAVTIRGRRA